MLLGHMLGRVFHFPAPFRLQVFVHAVNPPTCFLADPLEYTEDLMLLLAYVEAFGGNDERAYCNARYAPIFYMRNYTADQMGMVKLHLSHPLVITGYEGVNLAQEAHCGVVE